MTTIAEIRAQFPETTKNLSDAEIVARIAAVDDSPFDKVASEFGLKRRSAIAEMGRQAVASVGDAMKMVGGAVEWLAPEGSALEEVGRTSKEYWGQYGASGFVPGSTETADSWAPDTVGRSLPAEVLIKGARALAPSGMAMAATMANPLLGGAAVFATFGSSAAQDTYDKLKEAGVKEEDATKAALQSMLIEGGGETIADVAGGALLKGATGALMSIAKKDGLGAALEAAKNPAWLKRFGINMTANAGIQSSTEYGQNYGISTVENAYSPEGQQLGGDPHEQGVEGFKGGLGLSMILGVPSAVAHRANAKARGAAAEVINNQDAAPELRQRAADILQAEIEQTVGKDVAQSWRDSMAEAIVQDAAAAPERHRGRVIEEAQARIEELQELIQSDQTATPTERQQLAQLLHEVNQNGGQNIEAISQILGMGIEQDLAQDDATAEQQTVEATPLAATGAAPLNTQLVDIQQLPSQSQTVTRTLLDVDGNERDVTMSRISAPLAQRLQHIAQSIFGKELVFFQNADNSVENWNDGMFNDAEPGKIYLSIDSLSAHHMVVFGHELWHSLKAFDAAQGTSIAATFENAVRAVSRKNFDIDTLYPGAKAMEAATPGAGMEEINADLFGNRFGEEKFWSEVFASMQDKTAVQKVLDAINELIAKVNESVKAVLSGSMRVGGEAAKFRADAIILKNQLSKVRKAAVQAATEYAKASRNAPAVTAVPGAGQVKRDAPAATAVAQPGGATVGDITEDDWIAPADARTPAMTADELAEIESDYWSDPANNEHDPELTPEELAELEELSRSADADGAVRQSKARPAKPKKLTKQEQHAIAEYERTRIKEGQTVEQSGPLDDEQWAEVRRIALSRLTPKQRLLALKFEREYLKLAKEADIQSEHYRAAAERLLSAVPENGSSSVAIMDGSTEVALTGTGKLVRGKPKVLTIDIGRFFLGRQRKLDINSEIDRQAAAVAIAREAAYALTKDGHAVGWYDRKVREALAVSALVHPELLTNKNAQAVFKVIAAITSNGQAVRDNFILANIAYTAYKSGVPLTQILGEGGGARRSAMIKSLQKFDALLGEASASEIGEALLEPMSVADIQKRFGLKVSGEHVSTILPAAVGLGGPKIGSFFANLSGHFDSLTMDMWFMRTIGRVTGSIVTMPKTVGDNINQLDSLLPQSGSVNGIDVAVLRAEIAAYNNLSETEKLDPEEVMDVAKNIIKYARAQLQKFSAPDPITKKTFANKTPQNENARRLVAGIDSTNDSPSNGTERNNMRDVVEMARGILARHGIELNTADMQAVLWYYEKDLYTKLGANNASAKPWDYASAARFGVGRALGLVDVQSSKRAGQNEQPAGDSGVEHAGNQEVAPATKRGRSKAADEALIKRSGARGPFRPGDKIVIDGKEFDLLAENFGFAPAPTPLPDDHPLLRETYTPGQEVSKARAQFHQKLINDHFFESREDPLSGRRLPLYSKPVRKPQGKPRLLVMAGGGAAGKGYVLNLLEGEDQASTENAVYLDPDAIKTSSLPEYFWVAGIAQDSRAAAVTHEESSMLKDRIIERALSRGLNMVMDVTMANSAKGLKMLQKFKEAGYSVEMVAVLTDARVALKRGRERGERTGRYVPYHNMLEAHRGIADALPKYLETQHIDTLRIYDNSGIASTQPVLTAVKTQAEGVRYVSKSAYDEIVEKGKLINPQATTFGDVYGENYGPYADIRIRRADQEKHVLPRIVEEGFGAEDRAGRAGGSAAAQSRATGAGEAANPEVRQPGREGGNTEDQVAPVPNISRSPARESSSRVAEWAIKEQRRFTRIIPDEILDQYHKAFSTLVGYVKQNPVYEDISVPIPMVPMPPVLHMLKLPMQWVAIHTSIVQKAIIKHSEDFVGTDVTPEQLSKSLADPVMVIKSGRAEDEYEVITRLQGAQGPVMMALKANVPDDARQPNLRWTAVKTAFGKPISKVLAEVKQRGGRVLYFDQEAAKQLFPAPEFAKAQQLSKLGVRSPADVLQFIEQNRVKRSTFRPVDTESAEFKAWFGDWQKAALRDFLNGPALAELNTSEAPHKGYAALRDWAVGIFNDYGNYATHPTLGRVLMDERAVRDSIGHRINPFKAVAFKAVPEVIERGMIVARGTVGELESIYVSGPVRINDTDDVVTVLIHRDPQTQRMYLHSVTTKESLLNHEQSSAPTDEGRRGLGAIRPEGIRSILRDALNFKGKVSKVVDADGKPLVVYHGTNADIEAFDPEKIGSNFGLDEDGFFFSGSTVEASGFADPQSQFLAAGMSDDRKLPPREGGNVLPVYLSLKNPLTIDAYTDAFYTNPDIEITEQGISLVDYFDDNRRSIIAFAKEGGNDSVLFQHKGKTLAVAFDPTQIKSAISSTGEFSSTNPDIRRARARIPDYIKNASPDEQDAYRRSGAVVHYPTIKERIDAWKQDWKTRMVQGIFDQFAPIKYLGDKLQGKDQWLSERAYMLSRMVKSADGALEALLSFGGIRLDRKSGLLKMKDYNGGFLKIMQDTLEGEQDRFLHFVAGGRALQLYKEARAAARQAVAAAKLANPAITSKEEQRIYNRAYKESLKEHNLTEAQARFLNGKNASGTLPSGRSRMAAYQQALHEYNKLNDDVLDVAVASGLLGAAEAAEWKKNIFYVPFYRMLEDEKYQGPRDAGGMANQWASKRLKGGSDVTADLLMNVMRNWSHLLTASLKNQAAVETMRAAELAGVARRVGITKNGKKLGDLSVRIAGKEVRYEVDDPLVVTALSATSSLGNEWAMNALGQFKKWLTLGVTISPTFKIRNLIRDSISAIGVSPLSANVAKNLSDGWRYTDKKSKSYADMLVSGAMLRMGSYLEGDRADHVRNLVRKGIKAQHVLTSREKVQAFLSAQWDAWQDLGDRSENINRAAIYKQIAASAPGNPHAELRAAFAARDLMDFSLQGTFLASRFLAQVVPFFNARMQGMYKLGRAASDPQQRTKMAGVAMAVAMASVMLLLAYKDDDWFKNLEAWERDTFWWFKLGDNLIAIPKPFEIGAFGSMVERATEAAINDEYTGKDLAKTLKSILSNQLAMNPIPQMFKPMVDIYSNRNSFTGRDIESMAMERLSKSERYTESTSAVAQLLGKVTSVGSTGLSPVQIDHIIRGYFGWLGAHAVMAADFIVAPATDKNAHPVVASMIGHDRSKPAMRIDDYFVIGDFVKSEQRPNSKYVTSFYEQARDVQMLMADIKHYAELGDKERVRELIEDDGNKIKLGLRDDYQRSAKAITEINKKILAVNRSNMSAEDKRAAVDLLHQQRVKIATGVERARIGLEAAR